MKDSGSVVSDRYRLVSELVRRDHESIWAAHDETLDRAVKVWLFDNDHPRLARVLSAAQDVALISDPQLARILDVQERENEVVIVMEAPEDITLDSVLAGGPMPLSAVAHLANRMVMALEAGSSQGLFHQRLEPALIHVRPDNSVKITQLGIRAAAEGFDRFSANTAAKTDALGLCAVVFSCLMGRWHWRTPVSQFVAPMTEGEARALLSQVHSDLPAEVVSFLDYNLSGYAETGLNPRDVLAILQPYDSANLDESPQRVPMDKMPTPVAAPQRAAAAATTNGHGIRGLNPDTLLSFPAFNPQHDPSLQEAIREKHPDDVRRTLLLLGSGVAVALILSIGILAGGFFGTGNSGPEVSAPPVAAVEEPPADLPVVVEPEPEQVIETVVAVPEIVQAFSIDPQGDGRENPGMLPNLFDGKPATIWRTDGYKSASFGGLKDGLGVILEFSEPVDISTLTIDVVKGQPRLELHAASGPGAFDPAVLATAQWAGQTGTISLATPLEKQKYVAIWVTQLPRHSNGKFRLDVKDVTAS